MQIQFILDYPVAAAQLFQDLARQAIAPVNQFFAGFRPDVPRDVIAQAVRKRGALVAQPLFRNRLAFRARMDHPPMVGQGDNFRQQFRKQRCIVIVAPSTAFFHRVTPYPACMTT